MHRWGRLVIACEAGYRTLRCMRCVSETCLHVSLPPVARACQVNEAAEVIYDLVDPTANLIFGAVVDPHLGQEVSITLIATGFGTGTPIAAAPAAAERQAPTEPAQAERCASVNSGRQDSMYMCLKSASFDPIAGAMHGR